MKHKILLPLLLCLLGILSFPANAAEASTDVTKVPPGFGEVLDALPEELRDTLPPELFSEEIEELERGVHSLGSVSYLLRTTLSLLGITLDECLALLATLLGLLLLSAVANAARQTIGNEAVGRAFSFVSSLVLLLLLVREGWRSIESVATYFSRLNAISAALLPLTGTLYAVGGNLGAATASTAGLSIYLTVLEEVVGKSILPFCGVCVSLSLIGALDPAPRVGALVGTIKKNYTTLLAFLMMILNTALASQTFLGSKGDSLAMRSARFAAGNLIPVVGGSITELLRSVGVGIGYLRGTVGICAILLLLLSLLPTILHLYLVRLVFQLSASVGELLGCVGEGRLLGEFASLAGYLIAAALICSSVMTVV